MLLLLLLFTLIVLLLLVNVGEVCGVSVNKVALACVDVVCVDEDVDKLLLLLSVA